MRGVWRLQVRGQRRAFPQTFREDGLSLPRRQDYSAPVAVAEKWLGGPLLAFYHGSGTVVRLASSAGAIEYVFQILHGASLVDGAVKSDVVALFVPTCQNDI